MAGGPGPGLALTNQPRPDIVAWYNQEGERTMFGSIGPTELILIFVVALLVFGPKKLPEIGKSIGKALREFKKASEEIKGRIEEEIQASELKDLHKELKDGVNDLKSGIKGIADVTGVTDLKNDLKGLTEAPAQTPQTQTPPPPAEEKAKEIAEEKKDAAAGDQGAQPDAQAPEIKEQTSHGTGEGPKVS